MTCIIGILMKNSRQKKKDYHFVKRRVWIRYLNGYFNLDDHSDFIDKDLRI